MSDLIDRRMAIGVLCGCTEHKGRILFDNAVEGINKLPPAQPERIRGRWTRDNACSECGCQPWFSGDIHNYNFCPNCGAEMEVTT